MSFRLICLFAVFASLGTQVLAQEVPDVASITSVIEQLQSNGALGEDTRSTAIAALNDARRLVEAGNKRAEEVAGYVASAAGVNQTVQQLRAQLDQLKELPVDAIDGSTTLDGQKLQFDELAADLSSSVATIASLRSRDDAMLRRADTIATEIATANAEVLDLEGAPPSDTATTDAVAAAKRTLYRARLAERRAAITDLAKERSTLAARQEIVAARLALANAQMARQAAAIARLQDRLGQSRTAQAENRVRDLQDQFVNLADAVPAVQDLARGTIDLAKTNLTLVENLSQLAGETIRLQQDLARVAASAQTVDQVLETGQLNEETAALLRDVRYRLPDSKLLAETSDKYDQTLVTMRLNQVLWTDRLRNLADTQGAAKRFLAADPDAAESDDARQTAGRLVEERRDILQMLGSAARETSDELSKQSLLRQDLRAHTDALANLLDRRLLWLPTTSERGETFVRNLYASVAWLTSIEGWRGFGLSIVAGLTKSWRGPLGLAACAIVLLLMRPFFLRRLNSLASRVGNVDEDTYLSTPEALVISLGIALPWPLGAGAVGLAASQGATTSFATAISQGIVAMASVAFILLSFRVLTRNGGVFDRHFDWSERSRTMLRFHLSWFVVAEVLVAFVFTAALTSGDLIVKYGIGRLAFMASSIAIAVFAYYFLKPNSGIAASISADKKNGAGLRILFVLLVGAPLIIGVLPGFGYYEAAIEVLARIFQSGIVVLLAAVIYRLSMRLFMVGHRRLIAKREREGRQQEKAQKEAEIDAAESGDAAPKSLGEEPTDLEAVSDQSRRAIFAISTAVLVLGLWGVWSALLPALGIASDIVLWEGTKYVGGEAIASGISLWDVIVAFLWIIGGFVVARNVKGILELVLFERFSFDPGSRYATVTIARYVLIGVGLVVGLGHFGLDWSSLQWVVAALGVGLGFGLQEIVANFVSGLIILFERPVRVGDIVTIGQLEGTVTSIKIRATRITDFDNREVLMPNKSIITENVTNWTLNDQVTRIILRFGVAYGSDIDKVRDIILDAVSNHAETLSTPPPVVFFMAHGDSSLDFEARIFVATPSKRLPVTHDLNRAINLALAGNGIEIPFPQRDLHLRTADGLRLSANAAQGEVTANPGK